MVAAEEVVAARRLPLVDQSSQKRLLVAFSILDQPEALDQEVQNRFEFSLLHEPLFLVFLYVYSQH